MNSVFPGKRLVLKNIDDQHMGFPGKVPGNFFKDGTKLPAGNAFIGAEIYQDRLAALQAFFELFSRVGRKL